MSGMAQMAGFPSPVHAEHGFAMTWGGNVAAFLESYGS